MSPAANRDFPLLFVVMLAIAAGNTGLQSVLPAIGRSIGIPDLLVALAFSFSALMWSISASMWARRSDRMGRRAMILTGMGGYCVSLLLCGIALLAGIAGWVSATFAFAGFVIGRAVYGWFGSAAPPAAQAMVASRTSREERTGALSMLASAFGLGTILGPALAPFFVLPLLGLAGPAFVFALLGLGVIYLVLRRLPDDRGGGRGAAMSEPSISGGGTGASTILVEGKEEANAQPPAPVTFTDPRVWPWLLAGLVAGHAQAATAQTIAFLTIDRLALPPLAAQPIIGVVLMVGAVAALIAQWGIIPRFTIAPSRLVIWGAAVAAAGSLGLAAASDVHGIAVAFAITSLGYGLLRPGFTAGASLAVGANEQSAVAGRVTAINGFVFVLGPAAGMLLYQAWRPLPYFVATAALLLLLGYYLRTFRRAA